MRAALKMLPWAAPALLLMAMPVLMLAPVRHAMAQSEPPIIAVTTGDGAFTTLPDGQRFTNILDGLAAARDLAQQQARRVTVYVDDTGPASDGVWPQTQTISLDDADWPYGVEILGTGDSPRDVVVLATAAQLYSTPVFYLSGALDNVIIEGLTIEGGSTGVYIEDDNASVIHRCYIQHNRGTNVITPGTGDGHGIYCDGGPSGSPGAPYFINCMIRDNERAGIHVERNCEPYIVHCTMFSTAGGLPQERGVFVGADADGADARLLNSLMYRNDTGIEVLDMTLRALAMNQYNNAGGNVLTDYEPILVQTTGTGNLDLNPVVQPDGPWVYSLADGVEFLGKLQLDTAGTNDLIGAARAGLEAILGEDFSRYYRTDIDGGGRPTAVAGIDETPAWPDIGADEYDQGSSIGWWYDVNVIPPDPDAYFQANPPVAGEYFAAIGNDIEAGELFVEIRMSGAVLEHPDHLVFILPQGIDPGGLAIDEYDTAPGIIRFQTELVAPSYWLGSNADDIANYAGNIDGHGMVCVRAMLEQVIGAPLPELFGTTPNEINKISDGVRLFRHVIVDRQPPRLSVLPLSARAMVGLYSGNTGTNGALGAYSGSAPAGWRPDLVPPEPFSYDDGLIDDDGVLDQGAQAFFNVGGEVHGFIPPPLSGQRLDVGIQAQFADAADPGDAYDAMLGADAPRPASGFPEDPPGGYVGDPAGVRGYAMGPGQWRFVDNTAKAFLALTDTVVTYTTAPGGLNQGYLFGDADETAGLGDLNNIETDVVWRFMQPGSSPVVYGIEPFNAAHEHLHLAMRFTARDIAGNQRQVNPTDGGAEALDPLHIWWMQRVRSSIKPFLEGQEVSLDKAAFSWEPERSFEPDAAGDSARPISTYSVWRSTVAGGGGYDQPYELVRGWQPWSRSFSLGPADFQDIDLNDAALEGYWVWLWVAVADEAGNVEPVPPEIAGAGPIQYIGPPHSANWQRFYMQPVSANVDTQVRVVFYDAAGNRLGGNRLVPWGTGVRAEFEITPSFTAGPAIILWELAPDQGPVVADAITGIVAANSGQPQTEVIDPVDWPVVPTAARPRVSYVFRAATVDSGGNEDPTPGYVQFTLVYGNIEDYMRDQKGTQAIKEVQRD